MGYGLYWVVKELKFHGLKCVGKKIHDILFNSVSPVEQAAMLEHFAGECELLGGLHHPCVVQILGVCLEQGSPMPVLEYLHTTLSACLERYGALHKEISYGILHDVALGLCYVHEQSPSIIHRDLSANNVLLTSNMNAKISDLGVAKPDPHQNDTDEKHLHSAPSSNVESFAIHPGCSLDKMPVAR